jgi:hypothetical protein
MCQAMPQRRTPTIGQEYCFGFFSCGLRISSLPLASSPLRMYALDERVMPVLMAEKVMGLPPASMRNRDFGFS